MSRLRSLLTGLLTLCAAASLHASDHVDGKDTLTHRSGDITDLYAFPSPDREGRLVLALNVYPLVSGRGHFAEGITYRITVKSAKAKGQGLQTGFTLGEASVIDCTFADHQLLCQLPDGRSIQARFNDKQGTEADGVHLFAGRRADPFQLNAGQFATLFKGKKIPPRKGGSTMASLNVLSIVISIEPKRLIDSESSLLAVVAETLVKDDSGKLQHFDRIGRPEITNARLQKGTGTSEEELRNIYNVQDPFALQPEYRAKFAQRLKVTLERYDMADDCRDWSPEEHQALIDLWLNDYLVVDVSKPFTPQSYFDIERSMLRSQPHTRSGGRVPRDNALYVIFSTLVNGGHGPEMASGLSPTLGLPQSDFPYLAKPHRSPWSVLKTWIGSKAAAKIAQ